MANVVLKVEIIKKETIKSCSPTLNDLKVLKLSLLDQVASSYYIPLLLFYPSTNHNANNTLDSRRHLTNLKASLSATLSHFYPFAGQSKDNILIECNDMGEDFIEAQTNCHLVEILKIPNGDFLKEFLPVKIDDTDKDVNGRMLLVQATFFKCGGMVIGVSSSHKLCDASSIATFIKSWSSHALALSYDGQILKAEGKDIILPQFISASIFPPPTDLETRTPNFMRDVDIACVTRRLVFDASNILALKAKASSAGVLKPTRVEVVTGLIWKCATEAAKSISTIPKLGSVLCQTVNLRKRLLPPLQETSIGNLVGYFVTRASNDLELQGLVGLLREGINEFKENGVKNYRSDLLLKMWGDMMKQETGNVDGKNYEDFYVCSSWSRFNLYDADFGWGKPAWISIASLKLANVIVLMDTSDGLGIEAWVTLKNKDEMAFFECHEELLQYASINPSIV